MMECKDPLPEYERVAVFGMGASGIAVSRLLSRFHKAVLASDTAGESLRRELEEKLPAGVRLILGRNEIGDAQVIVTSPGLEPGSPIFEEAARRGVPVLAELDVAFRATGRPVVAVTGTDGKTTTTTLSSHILSACGVRNLMGGNVGIPFSQVVESSEDVDCFVVETSAFQLIFSPDFAPHILIATNIAEDHNEYFAGDRGRYIETKRRPLLKMSEGDVAILNASDGEIRRWGGITRAKVCWYGMSRQDIPQGCETYAYVDGGEMIFCHHGKTRRLELNRLKLKGEHNYQNVMGAVLGALCMGCDYEAAVASIDSYRLPPHRIELVCEKGGIRWIDDSKATNPHAAMAALRALEGPMVLIVGGVDKKLELGEWIDLISRKARHVMVIGALSERFCAQARARGIASELHLCGTLEEAVREGGKLACASGCGTVLLSPGCSSYDMFKSYRARGEAFAAAVLSL